MDCPHWIGMSRIRELLSRRVQAVQAASVGQVGPNRKKWFAALFALVSCICGYWAKELAETEASLKWGREHPPSSRVVRYSLESFGYRLETQPEKLHRVTRWIPAHLDETASFWMTRDLSWIAYFSDLQSTIQMEIFCISCKSYPKGQDWTPLGTGWIVFEELLQQIEKSQRELHSAKKGTGKKVPLRDPREILF